MDEELRNSGEEAHNIGDEKVSQNERLKRERDEQEIQFSRVILERELTEDLKRDEAIRKNNRGLALYKKKFFEEGVTLLREAFKLTPENETIANNLSVALRAWTLSLVDNGLYDEAIPKCKETIRMDDLNDAPHFLLGTCFYHKNSYKEAVKQYQKALSLAPDNLIYRNSLGLAYLRLEKYNEAIEEFEKCARESTKDDPERCNYYCNLGIIYDGKGMLEKAVGAFKKVVELKPTDDYVSCLAVIYYKLQLEKEGSVLEEIMKYMGSLDEKGRKNFSELARPVPLQGLKADKLMHKSKTLEKILPISVLDKIEKLWQKSLQMAKNYREGLND